MLGKQENHTDQPQLVTVEALVPKNHILRRLYAALAIAGGTVWSFSPTMISSGPRAGFFVSTFASVQGFRFADAAWKIGTPEPGTEYVSYSSFASSSPTAFAKP